MLTINFLNYKTNFYHYSSYLEINHNFVIIHLNNFLIQIYSIYSLVLSKYLYFNSLLIYYFFFKYKNQIYFMKFLFKS
jgi:hypothetical protein